MKKVFDIENLRAMDDSDVLNLLRDNSQHDVAQTLSVTPSQMSRHIMERGLTRSVRMIREGKSLRRFPLLKPMHLVSEDDIPSINAWKGSSERLSLVNAGLIKNISMKYI